MIAHPTLLFSALFAVIVSVIYGYAGWLLSKRVISSPEAQKAWNLFTVWWYALGVTTLIGGLQNFLGAINLENLPVFLTAAYVNILVICVALWGLLYYLIYLFTGSSRSFTTLIVFYASYYVMLVYYITAGMPHDVNINRWSTSISYSQPQTGPFFGLVIALLLLPQILGGIAYFTLYFRVTSATQKYRVLLVSVSIIVWFLSPLVAVIGGLSQYDWWQLASRFIGLAAALTILAAYLPPRWIKERYGIISLSEETRAGGGYSF